jgi:hypothetical protein
MSGDLILRRDFAELDAVGPMRVAAFVTGGRDEELQVDVVDFAAQLLGLVGSRVHAPCKWPRSRVGVLPWSHPWY